MKRANSNGCIQEENQLILNAQSQIDHNELSASGTGTSKPTIVLVHGAVEDSSLWTHGVIQGLHRKGYPVKVFSNPLRGVAHDDAKVKGLIYAGSPMPAAGESTNDCLQRFPGGDFASSVDLIPYTLPDGTAGTNLRHMVFARRLQRNYPAGFALASRFRLTPCSVPASPKTMHHWRMRTRPPAAGLFR